MNYCTTALSVIEAEAQAIFNLTQRIDDSFLHACELIIQCQGRIIVTGMGKSGHIARKISATLASTGTPSFFVHPGEASHGDLGMITPQDVVLALSNSGTTKEILSLLPVLQHQGNSLISLTGNPLSSLAKAATVHLDLSIEHEACPLNLTPTTSTTVALVMGDAIAIALLQARGFSAKDFALSHPGGHLGKQLLLTVNEIWHSDATLPIVDQDSVVSEALIEITSKKLGMACVVNKSGLLTGVFTDGDIRRCLNKNFNIHTTQIQEIISKNCITIETNTLAQDALNIMKNNSITSLVVVKEAKPIAVVHLHDILKSGLT